MSGSSSKPSGLRPPSKIARPSSGQTKQTPSKIEARLLNATRTEAIPPPDAIAHSARAAGMKPTQASQYAHHLAKNLVSSGRSSPSDSDQLDDYIIGDRVLVGGTKPGIIQFLGETRFAAGQWAGVVLDEPVGKNDGSVAGVRYFQCEPKKGVFSKVSKLIREPAGGVNAGSPSHHRPSGAPSTPRMGTKVGTKLPPSGRATGDAPDNLGLKVGDRVLVSGTKLGTLRYVGTTEFAKGEWCGVELDDELGKNDGAVAGTRYFTCKARHGLFAPIHKVTRAKGKAAKPPSTPMESTSKDKRSDSTSSVSSVSSLSSLSRSIGHGSVELTSPREKELKKQESTSPDLFTSSSSQQHEPAAAHLDKDKEESAEAETELAALRALHEKYVKDTDGNQDSLRTLVEAADREKVELSQQLEEERRKVEDLQFRLEEAAISKDDLKAASQQELQRIHTLEDRLVEENQRATKLQMEVDGFKNVMENKDFKLTELEMEALTYIEQIEDLQKKFKAAEDKILLLESSKLKDSELGEEIKQHINKIKELELQVLSLSNDKTEVQTTLSQVREELQDSVAARKKLESTVDGLQSKLKGSESTMENMDKEVHNLKNSLSDLQRQLKSSEEKCDLLSQDKSKLESEMSEMMKHSGDSSQQLTILNEQLRAKDRKLEELQESVSQSAQTVSKLNDTIVQNKEQSEKEAENTKQKHHQKLQDIQDELEKVQGELQKANIKIAKLVENHSKEREDLLQGKDSDIDELKMKLHSKEEELKQFVEQHDAFTKMIDQISLERDTFKNEKEKNNNLYKAAVKERDTFKEEKERVLVEKDKLEGKLQLFQLEKDHANSRFKQLNDNKDKLEEEKNKILKEYEDIKNCQKQLQEQRDIAMREKNEALAKTQQSEMKISTLQEELSRSKKESEKQSEIVQKLKEERQQGAQDLRSQLESAKECLEDKERKMLEIETDKSNMKKELTELQTAKEEKQQLEEAHMLLKNQLEELKRRENNLRQEFSGERESLQKSLDTTNDLIYQKDKEIDKQKTEIAYLKGENAMVKSYKSSIENLEQDKKQLNQQIAELQAALMEAQNKQMESSIPATTPTNHTNGDSMIAQLKEEKEFADSQVNFLNSVIVDIQKKNEELQARLDAIDESGINGDDDYEFDYDDMGRRMPAPRLFCDICDEFDLHDTDDCPQQTMSDSPPPTQYHGNRSQERPYCDSCEMFGHWTDECDDDQTY